MITARGSSRSFSTLAEQQTRTGPVRDSIRIMRVSISLGHEAAAGHLALWLRQPKYKTLRCFRAWALTALAFNFSFSNCRSCACASLACRRCLASASSCAMRTDSRCKSSLARRSASWSDWLAVDAISARKALVEVCVDCDEGAALCVDCGEGAALCKAKARFDGGGMKPLHLQI